MARREARILGAIFVALLLVGTAAWFVGREAHGLPTADAHADAEYYYVYLPALLRGDLDFSAEYRETHNWYQFGTTPTGHPGNVFGIGPAVVNAPLFLLGHVIARATGARADGFSIWENRLFTWASLPWSLGAVIVAYRLVRRRLGGGLLAIAGPLIAAMSGPVVYYAVRQPGYAHPMASFFSTLLVERWDASYDDEEPRSLRTWLVLGGLLGMCALVRPQLVLWGVLLVHAAVDDLRKSRALARPAHRLPGRLLASGALAAVVFTPQLGAWKYLYGRWLVVPQGAHFMRWDDPCWSEVLFSSRNGLFPWSPAYLLFAIALTVGVALPGSARRRLCTGLVAGVLLQTIANGAVWDWWAGGSFGGRRFDSAYAGFAVGASLLVVWAVERITPALRRVAVPAVRIAGAVVAAGLVFVLQLMVANLWLVSTYVVSSGPASTAARRRRA